MTFLGAVPVGMVRAGDQVIPSGELESTRSTREQPPPGAQFGHTTYTLPSPATSALGNGGSRRRPSNSNSTGAIAVAVVRVAPPSSERTAAIRVSSWNGITSTPPGRTTTCGAGAKRPSMLARPALSGDP